MNLLKHLPYLKFLCPWDFSQRCYVSVKGASLFLTLLYVRNQRILDPMIMRKERPAPSGLVQKNPFLEVGGKENNAVISFQIFMKTLDDKSKIFWVKALDEVIDLKKKMNTTTSIPATRQRLIFSGKSLQEGNLLKDYQIQRNSSIVLNLRLKGGYAGVSTSTRPTQNKIPGQMTGANTFKIGTPNKPSYINILQGKNKEATLTEQTKNSPKPYIME